MRLDAIVEPTCLFDHNHNPGDVSNQRPDIFIRNPRNSGKQVIIDVALTGVDGQSRERRVRRSGCKELDRVVISYIYMSL